MKTGRILTTVVAGLACGATACLGHSEALKAARELQLARKPREAIAAYRKLVEERRAELDVSAPALKGMFECFALLRGDPAAEAEYARLAARYLFDPPPLDKAAGLTVAQLEPDLVWKPWTITLTATNRPLSEVAAEIGRQSGVRIACDGESFLALEPDFFVSAEALEKCRTRLRTLKPDDPLVSVDFKDTGFLEAFETLKARTGRIAALPLNGLGAYDTATLLDRKTAAILLEGGLFGLALSQPEYAKLIGGSEGVIADMLARGQEAVGKHAGATRAYYERFRVGLLEISTTPREDPRTPWADKELRFKLHMRVEPGMAVRFGVSSVEAMTPDGKTYRDERGRPNDSLQGAITFMGDNGRYTYGLGLPVPANTVRLETLRLELKAVRGRAAQAERQPLSAPASFQLGDRRIEIVSLARATGLTVATLGGDRAKPGLQTPRSDTYSLIGWIEDDTGERRTQPMFPTLIGNLMYLPHPPGWGTHLVLGNAVYDLKRTVTVEFHDVELP
ncbi:MAG: hypothetical protein JXR37_27580 [Kiritimatiellae bacterium]|nr:hypothetical protein [Kiritimatiellia bacterium]